MELAPEIRIPELQVRRYLMLGALASTERSSNGEWRAIYKERLGEIEAELEAQQKLAELENGNISQL